MLCEKIKGREFYLIQESSHFEIRDELMRNIKKTGQRKQQKKCEKKKRKRKATMVKDLQDSVGRRRPVQG